MRTVVAVLVIGSLVLAACGSGGDDADDRSSLDGAQQAGSGADDDPDSDSIADEGDPEVTNAHSDSTEDGADDTDSTESTESGADDPGSDDDVDPATGTESAAPPDEWPLPTDAGELTTALDETELTLRRSGIAAEDAAPWGRRQQALYRVLAQNPDWADEVVAGVDPSIQAAVASNWTAQQALLVLVNSHTITETVPAWRIEPPAAADELLGYYREAEAATGVPWSILAAINLVETRMGRIKGVSSAGAIGPMQFLPTTWAECCDGDPNEPRDAINGAGRYLVQRGADSDLDRAIFGYNNSDHYVSAVRSYAAVLDADPAAYYGYHAWQVYYLSTEGVVVLPEGYTQREPVLAADWLQDHPETLFTGSQPGS